MSDKVRAELLRALKEILPRAEIGSFDASGHQDQRDHEIIERAKAAIALAEGARRQKITKRK